MPFHTAINITSIFGVGCVCSDVDNSNINSTSSTQAPDTGSARLLILLLLWPWRVCRNTVILWILLMLKDPLQKLDPSAKQALEGKDKKWKESDRLIFYNNHIYVPKNHRLCEQIIWDHHDNPLAGHPGRYKTQELIQQNYWWPQMAKNDPLIRWWVYQMSRRQNRPTTPTRPT